MPRDWRLHCDDIIESVARIQTYMGNAGFDDFVEDSKTQDAVIRNLEIIGEAARQLPNEIRAQAPDIEWRKIVAMRNMLIHEYFGINVAIVWDVVQNKLPGLKESCRRILAEN